MQFVHTLVYEIHGIIGPKEGDLVILDANVAAWACLTRDPNPYCHDADQSTAISTMLFRGLFGGGPEGSFRERLDHETALIREDREKTQANHTYLVLRRKGKVADWEPRVEREQDGYVIRLNGISTKEIREGTKVAFSSLFLALSFIREHPLIIRKHSDGLIFYRDDGKKVFAKALTMGKVSATISSPYQESNQEKVNNTFRTFSRLDDLSRVLRLLITSIEEVNNQLEAFLAGWAGLEIFISKVFSQYEGAFFGDLNKAERSEAHSQFVVRIRDVMKDKYRLTDRFALIASKLAPDQADEDVEQFKAVKKVRDDLYHGQDIDDQELPISMLHTLLIKYLQHHSEYLPL